MAKKFLVYFVFLSPCLFYSFFRPDTVHSAIFGVLAACFATHTRMPCTNKRHTCTLSFAHPRTAQLTKQLLRLLFFAFGTTALFNYDANSNPSSAVSNNSGIDIGNNNNVHHLPLTVGDLIRIEEEFSTGSNNSNNTWYRGTVISPTPAFLGPLHDDDSVQHFCCFPSERIHGSIGGVRC